jgi:hypothetical protein
MNTRWSLRLNVLPLLTRELRVVARQPLVYRERLFIGGGAMLFILVVAWGANLSGFVTGGGGMALLQVLAYAALGYSCLVGLIITADSLHKEKLEGTLGLLFMAGLSGWEIVLGKWLTGALRSMYGLLAAGPALAVCIAFGGVEGATVVRAMAGLLAALAFCLAVGVCASAMTGKSQTLGGIFALIAPLCLAGFPGVAWWLRHEADAPVAAWMVELLSPVWPLHTALHPPAVNVLAVHFHEALLYTMFMTFGLLVLAGWALERGWRTETLSDPRPVARFWHRIKFGSSGQRAARRSTLLAVNPFCWLNARDRLASNAPWLILVLTYGMMHAAWHWLTPDADPAIYWIGAWVLTDLFLKMLLSTEAGLGIWRHRETGAIELILATPLSDREVIQGQWQALWRRFAGPITWMTGINVAMLGYDQLASQWPGDRFFVAFVLCCLAVSLLDYLTLAWLGMWRGACARKTGEAVDAYWHVFKRPFALTLAALVALFFLGWWWDLDDDLQAALLLGWVTFCCIVSNLLHLRTARRNLFARFRQVLAETRASASATPVEVTSPSPAAGKSVSHRAPFRWRLGRKWRWAMAIVAVVALAVAGNRLWLGHRVKVVLRELEAAGEPVKLADLDKLNPYVPIAEDAGPAMKAALSGIFLPQSARTNGLLYTLETFQLRHTAFTDDQKASLAEVLTVHGERLAQLREAMKGERAWFETDWELASSLNIYRGLRSASGVLRLAAWARLENSDADRAAACALDLYRLAHLIKDTPNLYFSYARFDLHSSASQTLERLLSKGELTDAHLAVIDRATQVAETETDTALRRDLIAQRCFTLHELSLPVEDLIKRYSGPGKLKEAALITAMEQGKRLLGTHEREVVRFLTTAQSALDAAQKDFPQRATLPNQIEVENHGNHLGLSSSIRANGVVNMTRTIQRVNQAIARQRVTVAGIAAGRFRLKHGRYPGELKELVPEFLPAVPLDPYDGQPLRYSILPTGFSIHSIGEDFEDNGGVRNEKENQRKDILFTVER